MNPYQKYVDNPYEKYLRGEEEQKKVDAKSDITKSVATAPFKASANLVGLPQNIMSLLAMGASKGLTALGVPEKYAGQEALKAELPNFGDLAKQGFEKLGWSHTPQTPAGRYAGAAVEGALTAPSNPSMLLTGIGSGLGAEAGGDVVSVQTNDPLLKGVGSVAGGLLGGMVTGRLIQPLQSTLTEEQKNIVNRAKEIGMELTPGQQTGSRRMLAAENTSEALPGGGYLAKVRSENFDKANEIVSKSIGQTGKDLSPSVLGQAADDIGKEFERLSKGRNIVLDQSFYQKVRDAINNHKMLAKNQRSEDALKVLNDWLPPQGAGNARITSDVYQKNRSTLAADLRAAFHKDGGAAEAQAKKALLDALDDAASRSLPAADQAAFKEARRQWANLEAVEASNLERTGYNISPNSLANALRKQNKKVGRIPVGERDLVDVSRMGPLLKDALPNSGTPERSFWINAMTGGLGAGVGAHAGGLPGAVLGPMVTSYALPALFQRGIMAPGINSYLSRGLIPAFEQPSLTGQAVRAGALYE